MNVNIVWSTEDQSIPGAADYTQFRVGLGALEPKFVGLGERAVLFENVEPGDYVATVQLQRADGTSDVAELSANVSVPAPATAPVPVSIEATVGA